MTGPGATPVAGAVTYAGSTATFTPTVVLANSTLFTATITTGAKDSAGVGLAANFVWTFTTAPPPTVVSTIPANLAGAVAVNTPISATFSGAMNPATINAATFTVTGPGATPVAGAVTYAGTTATFTPTAVLANSTLVYGHDYHRSKRSHRRSTSRQLCVDLYDHIARTAHRGVHRSSERRYRCGPEHQP